MRFGKLYVRPLFPINVIIGNSVNTGFIRITTIFQLMITNAWNPSSLALSSTNQTHPSIEMLNNHLCECLF